MLCGKRRAAHGPAAGEHGHRCRLLTGSPPPPPPTPQPELIIHPGLGLTPLDLAPTLSIGVTPLDLTVAGEVRACAAPNPPKAACTGRCARAERTPDSIVR
jgi:hypothetical protein